MHLRMFELDFFFFLVLPTMMLFFNIGFLKIKTICNDYGIVCIRREGQDVEDMISGDEILNENRANIKIVDNIVPNQISSSRLR
ncbi:unnamed protein product [Arabidopsis halleri]